MEHWMLTHELNAYRHRELLREAQRDRLARRAQERLQFAGGRLAMALSLATMLVMALVRS